MKALIFTAGLLFAGAGVSAALAQGAAKDTTKPPGSTNAGKTVTVNGKAIPASRVQMLVSAQVAQGKPDNEQLRKAILDQLIAWELVVQEADRKGLSGREEVRSQIDLARQQIIFQSYLQDYLKTRPIEDDAVRSEYDKAKKQRGGKEYKARHILVEKEADAKDIIEQLKQGGDFESLAKQSKDIGSREKGGQLDWQPATTYVKPFGEALAKLDKGKTTEAPVKTQFGFHVIRLDDVRDAHFPAFDDVKQQITTMLQRREVERLVRDLRAKAKVE